MSFLKKLVKFISSQQKYGYKHFSSSDYYKHPSSKHHGYRSHNLFGHKYYKKKHFTSGFFKS